MNPRKKLLSSLRLAWSVALVASALAAWGWLRQVEPPAAVEPPPVTNPEAQPPIAVNQSVPDSPAALAAQPEAPAADDGMYVSPTAGSSLDLKYFPLDTEAVLALRPADLMRLPEGRELLKPEMLGDFARWLRHFLPQESRTTLGNIEQLLIGSTKNDSRHCLVLRFRDPVPLADLIAKKDWPAKVIEVAGQQVLERNNTGYWQPPEEGAHALVIVDVRAIPSIMRSAPLNMSQEILALLDQTDSNRLLTFVGTPTFLLQETGLFNQRGNLLLNPAAWFLTGFEPTRPGHDDARRALDPIPAVLFSAHLDNERAFAELLVTQPNPGNNAEAVQDFRDRVNSFGPLAARYVSALDENPLSRGFALAYPEWVRALGKYTRVGESEGRIMVRAYLPKQAPRRLLMGANLCLGARPLAWAPPNLNSLEGKLDRFISFEFDFDSLDQAMKRLSEEAGVPITIRHEDVQAEWLTKISLRFDQRETSARYVLVRMLKQFSPGGNLVFSIKPKPDGRQEIVITTRAVVLRNHEQLPVEFGGVTALLDRRTTLSVPRETPERLLQKLSEATGIQITIRPHDLMLEGITRGQSLGIHEVDKPAREILLKILKDYNPDGKIVYVIKPKQDGSGEEIIITTRAVAAKNGEQLPPELMKSAM